MLQVNMNRFYNLTIKTEKLEQSQLADSARPNQGGIGSRLDRHAQVNSFPLAFPWPDHAKDYVAQLPPSLYRSFAM